MKLLICQLRQTRSAWKSSFTTLALIGLLSACDASEKLAPATYDCYVVNDVSRTHPNRAQLQALLDRKVRQGVPGMLLSVRDQAGTEWLGAAGVADLYNQIPLKPCNITRVGSTVKTFTAVTVLMLYDEGLLDLDDLIGKYLPHSLLSKLDNGSTVTIRQLLNHSSGLFNYIQNLQFQTASLNELTKEWSAKELLAYAYGQKAYFAPGTDVRYSNTNYILLGMLIEQITHKPFYAVFEQKLFLPLGLTSTSFAARNPVPRSIIRGYADIYNDLNVIETTYYSGWDYYTADGGLLSNPHDMAVFLHALFGGKLLKASTLQEAMQWEEPSKQEADGFKTAFGLGFFKIETPYGIAYQHSGDAIGYYARMLYFPEKKATVVYATNGNYGRIDPLVSSKEATNEILEAVFK
ncbi:beta-lactamase family protein [Spirosoma sp. BT702]|uniref:Beta-lactamase family protein n=1 Tax=Spirosoma profusum TaxID=2771354 RepID=A0A927AW12_9BACT|nr:serine hydrolase domain-containing protein [Spirosoma profusum]MBD2705485.1 beta-lactamase family protein [Spirosoma profusum]